MTHPSILVVKSDQHNARCLGANGHPQVETPNLDRMAREGVNFTSAFVQSPICTPSRMSYLSGQYVHNHGHFGLVEANDDVPLPDELPSMFSVFKSSGYRTGIVGHIHVKESWLKPHCDLYRDLHEEGNSYDAYLAAKGLLHLRDDGEYEGRSQIKDGCPSRLSFEDSYEGFCLRTFCEFLDNLQGEDPFFFQLDTVHPHQNYIPVREFWDMYDGVELELPPSADEDLTNKPPHQQLMLKDYCHNYDWPFEPKTYEAGQLRKLRGYYGCISQVDHMVGLALKKLREMGREENTIVIYCSDHGDFALEHGFLEKAPGISYDAILRTPFIWRWPGTDFNTGSTAEELVESVDVFPTLCALTGIAPPDTLDGCDISPMLRGSTTPVRQFVVAEFPLSRTIRTKEWKLCHRPRSMFKEKYDAGELYNVIADPWEMTNLYDDPRYREVREDLRRELFDWIQLTTRYNNVWPNLPPGADGKATQSGLRNLLDDKWGSMYL